MPKPKKEKPTPQPSGYAEQQPVPRKHQKMPDAKTPHEAHNVPTRKPGAASA